MRRPVVVRLLADADVPAVLERLGLARLHQGDGRYLVAWDGAVPVGHVHLANGDVPEMQDLEVHPDNRGHGVAVALVTAAEDAARASGASLVRLEVSVDNAPARRLYERCGYTPSGAPPRRVDGVVAIRTGPIEVHDVLLTMQKRLGRGDG